jgi:hypothetical protein
MAESNRWKIVKGLAWLLLFLFGSLQEAIQFVSNASGVELTLLQVGIIQIGLLAIGVAGLFVITKNVWYPSVPRSAAPMAMAPETLMVSAVGTSSESEESVQELLLDVTKRVRYRKPEFYRFSFNEGDGIVGEIVSDRTVGVFLVTLKNWRKYKAGESYDYLGDEGITQCKFDEVIDVTGRWYLFFENQDESRADAHIKATLKKKPIWARNAMASA